MEPSFLVWRVVSTERFNEIYILCEGAAAWIEALFKAPASGLSLLYCRMEWFTTFLRFSKMNTLLPIRYILMSSIPKNCAGAANFSFPKSHRDLKNDFFHEICIKEHSPEKNKIFYFRPPKISKMDKGKKWGSLHF